MVSSAWQVKDHSSILSFLKRRMRRGLSNMTRIPRGASPSKREGKHTLEQDLTQRRGRRHLRDHRRGP